MATLENIEDWISRCALGDRAAFSSLYDATSAKLFGVCLRVLKHRGEAEECLQEAYIRIWRKADSYMVTGHSPMTWLITVTRNLAIDRLRARKPQADDIADRPDISAPGPTPEAAVIAGSEARRISACMDELEQGRADAVRGAYLDGDTYQVLAERHGVPLNTMRTWLRRSLQKLKECLSR